jgi:P27 family predicted phage terminase small subunit
MGRLAKPHSKRSRPAQPIGELPDPPQWLDEEAVKEWYRIKGILETRGILSAEDWGILGAYCSVQQLLRMAWGAIAETGLVVSTANGLEMPAPGVAISKQMIDLGIKLAARLGLSPADRASMRIESPAETSDPATLRFFAGPQSN